jgi:ribosome maturation factor RimP
MALLPHARVLATDTLVWRHRPHSRATKLASTTEEGEHVAAANPERVRAVVAPVVASAGLDLEDLSVTAAGRRRLLRIAVDRDGGVSLDDVAAVSQRVSAALDSSDVMGGQPYVLEVGSPGVGRPLTHPKHWRRAVGHLVEVTLVGGSSISGRVLVVDDGGVVLDVPGGDHRVSFDSVARARVEVEFRRTDEAGASADSGDLGATGDREG